MVAGVMTFLAAQSPHLEYAATARIATLRKTSRAPTEIHQFHGRRRPLRRRISARCISYRRSDGDAESGRNESAPALRAVSRCSGTDATMIEVAGSVSLRNSGTIDGLTWGG